VGEGFGQIREKRRKFLKAVYDLAHVSRSQGTHKLQLRFHALLTDGTREVRFERVAAG
jgi:hypothetical protein